MRSPTAIAVLQQTTLVQAHLIALCDDKTIWALPIGTNAAWARLPSIPQEETPIATLEEE